VVAATAPIAYDSGTQTVSTSMATNRLLGRTSAGAGVAEEISVGSGLSLAAGTLSATGGVGGLTHFAESESTAAPNATVPVDAFTATDAAYTNIDVALVAKGTGATLAQVPDGTVVGGNKRGAGATDWQKSRNSSNQVASAPSSTIGGGERNRASGSWGTVGGGFLNIASSDYSGVATGRDNSATSNYGFVGGGQTNSAQVGTHATVCGGNSNGANGQYSFIGGGDSNAASGQFSWIGGGFGNQANGTASFVSGIRGNARSVVGNHVWAACSNPIEANVGRTQKALLLLGRQTTDATATVLASNSSAASFSNQVTLPNNSAYSFSGEVIAGVTGAGDTARWTISGAIKRGANAASTVMVGTPTVTMTHNDAGASAWVVAVTANTTLGCITVTVTGAALATIRWVAKIETTEMTF
jgi:hypothetical protein